MAIAEILSLSKDRSLITETPVISIDPVDYRPIGVDILIGDTSRAKTKLGLQPKVKFEELIKIMINHDLKILSTQN